MLDRWKGASVAIIASGPSLTRADADYARLAANRVIVINRSWLLCPKADVLYAADERWYRNQYPKEFDGEKWSSARNDGWRQEPPPLGVRLAKTKQGAKLSDSPEVIYEGSNSSFQAMNLAVVWGARKIVFIGLDLQHTDDKTHWHGDHTGGLSNPTKAALAMYREAFETVAPDLQARGVEVINASRSTSLTCFPRKVITDALP